MHDRNNIKEKLKQKLSKKKLEEQLKKINPEHYKILDEQYMEEYNIHFNINPEEETKTLSSIEEQIKCIGENYLFWLNRKPIIDNVDKCDSLELTKLFMTSNGMNKILEKAKDLNLLKEVLEYVEQIEKNKKILIS